MSAAFHVELRFEDLKPDDRFVFPCEWHPPAEPYTKLHGREYRIGNRTLAVGIGGGKKKVERKPQ